MTDKPRGAQPGNQNAVTHGGTTALRTFPVLSLGPGQSYVLNQVRHLRHKLDEALENHPQANSIGLDVLVNEVLQYEQTRLLATRILAKMHKDASTPASDLDRTLKTINQATSRRTACMAKLGLLPTGDTADPYGTDSDERDEPPESSASDMVSDAPNSETPENAGPNDVTNEE